MKLLLQAIKSLIRSTTNSLTKEMEERLAGKPDAHNLTATGSFSLGRKEGSEVGKNSFAAGVNTTASGDYSHAEGSGTTASGDYSHAEGVFTTASGRNSHAEGYGATASGSYSHAEGWYTTASGEGSHAEGGEFVTASGDYSHCEGWYTTAASDRQHVQGKYNIEDADNKYAHIVGNGTSSNRSNAHTLDWDGNGWFAGTVEGTALILKSSTANSTKRFKITVDDSGTLSATEITA